MSLLIALIAAAAASTGTVRAAYTRLMRAGCALDDVQVWSPLEARALRNTPYAIAGYRFSDPELLALYASDGVWFQATTTDVTLSAADAACAEKLKERESTLREDFSFAVPSREAEARLAADAGVFVPIHAWSQRTDTHNPFGDVTAVRSAEGGWHVSWTEAGCESRPEQAPECGRYTIECPAEGACTVSTAG